ncbi:double-strand break repair protein AddB [Breoghania sp. L-A4]|uniref:double-strand break repair protein AddB n=1 Tax=Breoghania sp. L-A4 TaxID=2304600 RepID=UPI000E35E096|nr:double-strand break repair protein AddB [Breoghania sp. L-A4]AXS39074.1 double-strand break repair protein AddB [Breoghania sp. L-A4]
MTDTRPAARLFTIPSGAAFLDTLVDSLLSGELVPGFDPARDPLALADATIFVPTRRAARTLRESFRLALGGSAALLPRIRPLGGADEDEVLLRGEPDAEPLAPAISGLERRLAMTRLILGWAGHVRREVLKLGPDEPMAVPASPADAAWLAADLLSLMDQIETEEADWQAIQALVPDDFSRYWQITLDFLKIATEAWPAYLAERGAMDPNARRSALIRREAARFAQDPPSGPVIVAGSTGSVPATADLIKVVAHLHQGAVILPGLDQTMPDDVWDALGGAANPDRPAVPGHPQYGLKQLLSHLRASRADVSELSGSVAEHLRDRERIVAESLRPAETTDGWQAFFKEPVAARAGAAFADVDLIEARNEVEEALALAMALREAVENDRTAALVTPDRTLARRVAGEMRRWGLEVDDSAGRPLDQTPPAMLARLTAQAALGGLEPVALLALLKHPLTRLGLPAADIRETARALERAVLRGPRPQDGTHGLLAAIDAAEHALSTAAHVPRWRRMKEEDWARIRDLAQRLAAALQPLEALGRQPGIVAVAPLAEAHAEALKAVARDETGSDLALFSLEAGEALAKAMTGIMEARDVGLEIPAADWPSVFDALIAGSPVHGGVAADPRIHIWGPLEARLHRPDILILAGLNEGSWPATTRNDPWLNRPMKRDVGLEPPERRVGLAAHDFAQGMGADRVVLSRSRRSGGAPTVASRWLQRVLTVAGSDVADAARARGTRYTDWARALDRAAGPPRPAARPNPKPPVAARPEQISITSVETWIRDPYAIFAKRILGLDPVDPLAASPGAADRGTIIHDTLADFLAECSGPYDAGARDRLITLGREQFRDLEAFPEVHALWWPRFLRIADWFIGFEAARNPRVSRRHLEVAGSISLPRRDGVFRLTGRADRIDEMTDGSLAAIDYKTGGAPTRKEVATLFAPQLPLEAAMLRLGGFEGIDPARPVSELAYVVLRGGSTPGDYAPRNPEEGGIGDLADNALARLAGLIAAYDDEAQGYLSRARPKFEGNVDGDYDHLARVQEWSLGGDDEETA